MCKCTSAITICKENVIPKMWSKGYNETTQWINFVNNCCLWKKPGKFIFLFWQLRKRDSFVSCHIVLSIILKALTPSVVFGRYCTNKINKPPFVRKH